MVAEGVDLIAGAQGVKSVVAFVGIAIRGGENTAEATLVTIHSGAKKLRLASESLISSGPFPIHGFSSEWPITLTTTLTPVKARGLKV